MSPLGFGQSRVRPGWEIPRSLRRAHRKCGGLRFFPAALVLAIGMNSGTLISQNSAPGGEALEVALFVKAIRREASLAGSPGAFAGAGSSAPTIRPKQEGEAFVVATMEIAARHLVPSVSKYQADSRTQRTDIPREKCRDYDSAEFALTLKNGKVYKGQLITSQHMKGNGGRSYFVSSHSVQGGTVAPAGTEEIEEIEVAFIVESDAADLAKYKLQYRSLSIVVDAAEPAEKAKVFEFPIRTWKNAEGRALEARFVSISGDGATVKVCTPSDEVFDLPLASLSPSDQEWVRTAVAKGR